MDFLLLRQKFSEDREENMGGVSQGLSLIRSLKYRAISGPPEHKDLWLVKYFALSVVLTLRNIWLAWFLGGFC